MFPTTESQAQKFKRLSDYVYELLPEPNPDVEVVFLHGLQMQGSAPAHSFWRTWKMRNSEDCWPEMLLPKPLKYQNGKEEYKWKVRVLSVSYEAKPNLGEDGRGRARGDEYLISESLHHDVILGGVSVGQRAGVPVFLVGHDLGGIMIKQFVMMVEEKTAVMPNEGDRAKSQKFLENLKSVVFFATPHAGSRAIEKLAEEIGRDNQNPMLRLMKVLNKETSRINQEFQSYRRGQKGSKTSRFTSHAFHAAHVTNEGGFKNVMVVPEGTARSDVDTFYTVQANHFSICQPEDEFSSPIRILKHEIVRQVQEAKRERDGRL